MSERASATQSEPRPPLSLDEIVEAFEVAWNEHGPTDVATFLPDSRHPSFSSIALELLCVDLERRRTHGRPASVDEYCRRFAWLSANPEVLERLAFEEYRLLRAEGHAVRPNDYASRLKIRTEHWPGYDSTHVDCGSTTFPDDVDHPERHATFAS